MLNKVIISGGGTGGHIFPAVAIAQEIQRQNPNSYKFSILLLNQLLL